MRLPLAHVEEVVVEAVIAGRLRRCRTGRWRRRSAASRARTPRHRRASSSRARRRPDTPTARIRRPRCSTARRGASCRRPGRCRGSALRRKYSNAVRCRRSRSASSLSSRSEGVRSGVGRAERGGISGRCDGGELCRCTTGLYTASRRTVVCARTAFRSAGARGGRERLAAVAGRRSTAPRSPCVVTSSPADS